ncbi:hypothetical protein HZ326_24513 [Fusarium oxysporum f. sp. albedinis]|nr:hypothetical protein HZ326_24513 [Fusarium oxysporum f. sp. albedinis]
MIKRANAFLSSYHDADIIQVGVSLIRLPCWSRYTRNSSQSSIWTSLVNVPDMSCKSRADIELSPTLSFIEEKFVVGSAILRLLTLVHRLENFPGQAESNISVVLPNSVGKADRISPKKSSAPGDHDSIALVLVRPSVSRPSVCLIRTCWIAANLATGGVPERENLIVIRP